MDVVDVVPKQVFRTYLLTLCNYLGPLALRPVTYRLTPSYSHAYLGHNIHNIPNTPADALWHAPEGDPVTDPAETLALPMPQPNDAIAATIGDYLVNLLGLLWAEDECFSGKRPFGNSGWKWDLYPPLIEAVFASGELDEDGYIDTVDEKGADALIAAAIEHMRTLIAGGVR